MVERHQIDLDEHRLQSEIKITDLEQKAKRQEERLALFESQMEFQEILSTYNAQMGHLEQENNMLLIELKRNCKVESIHARTKSELQAKKFDNLNCE